VRLKSNWPLEYRSVAFAAPLGRKSTMPPSLPTSELAYPPYGERGGSALTGFPDSESVRLDAEFFLRCLVIFNAAGTTTPFVRIRCWAAMVRLPCCWSEFNIASVKQKTFTRVLFNSFGRKSAMICGTSICTHHKIFNHGPGNYISKL